MNENFKLYISSGVPRPEIVFTDNGSFKSMTTAIKTYEINANLAP